MQLKASNSIDAFDCLSHLRLRTAFLRVMTYVNRANRLICRILTSLYSFKRH